MTTGINCTVKLKYDEIRQRFHVEKINDQVRRERTDRPMNRSRDKAVCSCTALAWTPEGKYSIGLTSSRTPCHFSYAERFHFSLLVSVTFSTTRQYLSFLTAR